MRSFYMLRCPRGPPGRPDTVPRARAQLSRFQYRRAPVVSPWSVAVVGGYLSTVLPLKPIPWIEEQTGVAYSTLKRHDGRLGRRTEP